MSKKTLDMTGEVCPYPLLLTKKELEKMKCGDILLVETDFNQSVRNIIKWCEDNCHEISLDEIDNGLWLITITKGS